jgi:acyl-CoA thioesterase-2
MPDAIVKIHAAKRRVVAVQNGRAISDMSASFHLCEEGYEHQDDMPEVVP